LRFGILDLGLRIVSEISDLGFNSKAHGAEGKAKEFSEISELSRYAPFSTLFAL